MRVALGFKAHSGWAALVALGESGGTYALVDRRRVELVEHRWASAPFHAAEELPAPEAERLVRNSVDEGRRTAVRELREAIARTRSAGHTPVACAVLMPAPMPPWSVEQIRAVHVRMHKAEGVMFPDALARAVEACGMKLVAIPAKELPACATATLKEPPAVTSDRIALLGTAVGAPWGADQKSAALAAMIALSQA
jgi:hypothetical protein